jgi:hypothetical protein
MTFVLPSVFDVSTPESCKALVDIFTMASPEVQATYRTIHPKYTEPLILSTAPETMPQRILSIRMYAEQYHHTQLYHNRSI